MPYSQLSTLHWMIREPRNDASFCPPPPLSNRFWQPWQKWKVDNKYTWSYWFVLPHVIPEIVFDLSNRIVTWEEWLKLNSMIIIYAILQATTQNLRNYQKKRLWVLTSDLHLYGDLSNGDFKLNLESLNVAKNPHGQEGGGNHPGLGIDRTPHVTTTQWGRSQSL